MTAKFTDYPKALLHDHLDGGLRIETVLELADEAGYELPARDPAELATAFHQGESGSLESYLEAFTHTTSVMQTTAALERVAYEAVVDLAADGVRYTEVRFAPSLHTAGGLEPTAVVAAVAAGIKAGEGETGCIARLIVAAMRTMSSWRRSAWTPSARSSSTWPRQRRSTISPSTVRARARRLRSSNRYSRRTA